MTLPHHNATATVTIDGLAVCCYNKTANAWEVGYLHVPCHSLLLKIEDEPVIEILGSNHTEIRFTATNPRTPSYPGEPNGFFDPSGARPNRKEVPTTADRLENFRWIINVQDPSDVIHGNASPKKATSDVTRAFIHHGVAYTTKIIKKEVFEAPFTDLPQHNPNNMNNAQLEQHRFGRTNDEIATDIFCDPVGGAVTITIPGVLQQPRVLPHRPGEPWKIRLTNLCLRPIVTTNRFEIGDFQLFYDVLTVNGQKQAIWGEPVTDAEDIVINPKGGKESGRVDCDITWMGNSETLNPIMP